MTTYDDNNIFAKILRGDIPSQPVYEDDHVIVLNDIAPKKPVHLLIIPKGKYVSMTEFSDHASDAEIVAMSRAVAKMVREKGLAEKGYRLIANTGAHGGQEVPHLHWHLLGGAPVGAMVSAG